MTSLLGLSQVLFLSVLTFLSLFILFYEVLVYGLLVSRLPTWSLPSDQEGLVPTMLNKWELEGVVFFLDLSCFHVVRSVVYGSCRFVVDCYSFLLLLRLWLLGLSLVFLVGSYAVRVWVSHCCTL